MSPHKSQSSSNVSSDTTDMMTSFYGDNCDHWVVTKPTSRMLNIQLHIASPYRSLTQPQRDSLEKELFEEFGLN